MDTYMVNIIGEMLARIIEFIINVSPGYVIITVLLFVTAIVMIYLRFTTNIITKPKW